MTTIIKIPADNDLPTMVINNDKDNNDNSNRSNGGINDKACMMLPRATARRVSPRARRSRAAAGARGFDGECRDGVEEGWHDHAEAFVATAAVGLQQLQ